MLYTGAETQEMYFDSKLVSFSCTPQVSPSVKGSPEKNSRKAVELLVVAKFKLHADGSLTQIQV